MKAKAKREAANVGNNDRVFGVEDINPRSHAIRDLRMAVKRAQHLDSLLGEMLEYAKTYEALARSPVRHVCKADDWDLVKRVYDWEWTVMHWADGGLRRSIEDVKLNLPAKVREKL